MAYLRKSDYFAEIREKDLDELIEQAAQETGFTPNKVRLENELNTQSLVEDMIRNRYDVNKIFKDVIPFVLADQYQIEDLVEYTETAYDSSTTYVSGNRVSYRQKLLEGRNQVLLDDIYEATSNVTPAEPFDSSKWSKVTESRSLYVCKDPSINSNPDTAFAFTTNNFTGNHDLIKGWDTSNTLFFVADDFQVRMYYSSADRSADNNSVGVVDFRRGVKEFPDNRPILKGTDNDNILGGDLSFIGFIPDDTNWSVIPSNNFTKEDNRNRSIRKIVIDLAIANLHKLISPKNVPEHRLEAKDDAMMWLKKIESGAISADLPLYFDENRGARIQWNSNIKRDLRFEGARANDPDRDTGIHHGHHHRD